MEIRDAVAEDAHAACRVLRRSIAELCHADHRNDPAILSRWLGNKTPEFFMSWISRRSPQTRDRWSRPLAGADLCQAPLTRRANKVRHRPPRSLDPPGWKDALTHAHCLDAEHNRPAPKAVTRLAGGDNWTLSRRTAVNQNPAFRPLAWIFAAPIRIAMSLAGGVCRVTLARLDRAPRPTLPRRTQSWHSYNQRYRHRTPRPDLSSASRRRELPRDGCANSHETEAGAATGDGLLAKYGGGVSMARKVPSGRKARLAIGPRTAACKHNPAPEPARRSLIVHPRGRVRLTGYR